MFSPTRRSTAADNQTVFSSLETERPRAGLVGAFIHGCVLRAISASNAISAAAHSSARTTKALTCSAAHKFSE